MDSQSIARVPHEIPAIMRCSMSLFYLGALYLACSVSESLQKMPDIEASVTSDDVTETHHASCKIATEEIVANARATVTRVFTGACKAKTMDEKFASLEEKLVKEFADVKWLLYSILEQHPTRLENERSANIYEAFNDYLSPRQAEINKFNNTIQNVSTLNAPASAFIYYWQVENFDEMLISWQTGRSVRGPNFYIGRSGYAMYLRITPRYFPDGTVFVSVGLTRGRYDSVLAWPFPLRIRLEVLDHSPERVREDRQSRIWDPATLCTENFWGRPALIGKADNPECVGLSIPRHIILSKSSLTSFQQHSRNTRYMWNGGMLIKLIIYL